MDTKIKRFLLVVLAVLPVCAFSQNDPLKKHKIAIFAPLYLDSAFDASNEYRYAKNSFPKFINPGLEFYEGAQLALDSLAKEGVPLEVFVYDSRSATETLEQQLARWELKDAELLIAHCSSSDVRIFSEFALTRNIPFINTTLPNDAGVSGNPFYVILNPTLRTQCEGIYKYVQKYYASSAPIVVFHRKGVSDDMIRGLFDEYSRNTMSAPLKLKFVPLNDSFTTAQLLPYLDSNRKNFFLAGSLDINFGKRLVQQLAAAGKKYSPVVMGMPTWEGISRDFSKSEFKGVEIIYSTPFYNPKTNPVSQAITSYFTTEMYARPTDMVFRGYEVTWKFSKLLLQYGKDLSSNITNKQNQVFSEYDIQPVINRDNTMLDYFENKKLYFVKWFDGSSRLAN